MLCLLLGTACLGSVKLADAVIDIDACRNILHITRWRRVVMRATSV